jgi:hypothetical protein
MNELCRLLLNCLNHLRMTMAGRTDCDARIAVQKEISIDVVYPNSLGVIGDEFEGRPWISRIYELSIRFDNRSGFGPGKLGLDFRPLRNDSRHNFLLEKWRQIPRH